MLSILREKPVDLVVLCHTLSEREMIEIASLARERAAARIVLLKSSQMEGSPPNFAADAVVVAQPELEAGGGCTEARI